MEEEFENNNATPWRVGVNKVMMGKRMLETGTDKVKVSDFDPIEKPNRKKASHTDQEFRL
jgi:hypothetical protein